MGSARTERASGARAWRHGTCHRNALPIAIFAGAREAGRGACPIMSPVDSVPREARPAVVGFLLHSDLDRDSLPRLTTVYRALVEMPGLAVSADHTNCQVPYAPIMRLFAARALGLFYASGLISNV